MCGLHVLSLCVDFRLLSTQCASELFDLFDKSSMYALDYNDDDDMLLQVQYNSSFIIIIIIKEFN